MLFGRQVGLKDYDLVADAFRLFIRSGADDAVENIADTAIPGDTLTANVCRDGFHHFDNGTNFRYFYFLLNKQT